MQGLSLVVASGGHSSSQCAGLSLSWPLVAEHRLQTCRLSNCGSRAQLFRSMCGPPRPGLEPVSPALAGRFSTAMSPGKPLVGRFFFFFKRIFFYLFIYLFIIFVCIGSSVRARAFSSCGKRGPLFIAVRGPLTIVASCCGAQAPDVQAQ